MAPCPRRPYRSRRAQVAVHEIQRGLVCDLPLLEGHERIEHLETRRVVTEIGAKPISRSSCPCKRWLPTKTARCRAVLRPWKTSKRRPPDLAVVEADIALAHAGGEVGNGENRNVFRLELLDCCLIFGWSGARVAIAWQRPLGSLCSPAPSGGWGVEPVLPPLTRSGLVDRQLRCEDRAGRSHLLRWAAVSTSAKTAHHRLITCDHLSIQKFSRPPPRTHHSCEYLGRRDSERWGRVVLPDQASLAIVRVARGG